MDRKIYLILVLAAVFRLICLGSNPPGLSWDEASLGYNAWSIVLTGRDEHGRFLPHDAFVAFGDYKPPLYIYAAVPFVKLLGPTALAIRLPSALAGILAVLLTYLFASRLFLFWGGGLKDKAELIGLAAAFLLAISPWHLQLSRTGIEANLAATLVLAGATLLIYATQKPQLLPVAPLFLVASLYTFNRNRFFTP
jgi:4-amino-4-deoxy-L-arabinose transferase-like glycosyltransferase